MRKMYFISLICLSYAFQVNAQGNIILNFTGLDNTQPISIDYVWIKNVTKDCDTTLPQGVMSIDLGPVGINDHHENKQERILAISVIENPFRSRTELDVFMPDKGYLTATVNDMSGRNYLTQSKTVDRGTLHLRFTAGNQGIYVLTFTSGTASASVKLISLESTGFAPGMEFTGSGSADPLMKSAAGRGFTFTPGDELILVGYSGGKESGTIESPSNTATITFQFAKSITCPGLPTVTYEGKVYNTVQIMSQCWLKENIDLGDRIDGAVSQADNGVIEKYCFNNDINKCNQYGGLYQWSEMMKYISDSISIRGICPGDWHIPTDLEWMLLEGVADSQYGIGDPFWWHDGNRGFDAGKNLKSTTGWNNNGSGTDLYGFTALPGGIHHDDNTYIGDGKYGCFWTSSRSISVFASTARTIDYYYNLVYRDTYERSQARSVRCVKNH